MTIPKKGPLPGVFYARLPYFDKGYSIDPGIGTPTFYYWQANSAYDPDGSGVGHQPRGWDQLAALYNNYEVYYATITVSITSYDVAQALLLTLGVNDANAWADFQYLPENKHVTYMTLCHNSTEYSYNRKLKMKVSPHRFLGRKKGDDVMQATTTASPNQLVYFLLSGESATSSNPGAFTCCIYMTQYIRFFDPKSFGSS